MNEKLKLVLQILETIALILAIVLAISSYNYRTGYETGVNDTVTLINQPTFPIDNTTKEYVTNYSNISFQNSTSNKIVIRYLW